jgi:GNAT superfamily N-acetyltransferase
MAPEFSVRRATASDVEAMRYTVHVIMCEVYGHLTPELPPPPEDDWSRGWVAKSPHGLIGVGLTGNDTIDDLWVLAAHRGSGVGSVLLSALETEIAERGYALAKLRVVAENARARKFYAKHGWREVKTYPHERWNFLWWIL